MQRMTQKVVNTFVKGLITEAGELTFPENASVDELNCDLRRDGSRRRRLAAAKESNSVLSTFTITDSELVNTGTWSNVGGQTGLEFLVVQKGATLHFYNKAEAPYSDALETNSIDLTAYEHATSNGAGIAGAQFASIQGALVVASPEINTIYIQRDNTTGALTVTTLSFRTRDFEWQGDRSTYDAEGSSSPGAGRIYDTQNTGWAGSKGAAALSTYRSANSNKYPPLTHPWYSGKDNSGNFSESEWKKVFGGSSLIGNGYYILDFFTKDRQTASGVSGIGTDPVESRFAVVEAFGERVFYAGLSGEESGTILFSRIVETLNDLGECFQQNDPTSEEISDLLDNDGGVIKISGCVGIKKLYNIGSALFVFAENGIWKIDGVDGVFRASQYSIQKISEVGLLSETSFVAAEGIPFWWSRFGIHTMTFEQVSGQAREENISISTIQSYWDDIGTEQKLMVKAVYDRINKRIYWGYPNNGETVNAKINNFLLLDVPLQAFIPWEIKDESGATDAIVGLAFYSGYGSGDIELDVITSAGDDVVTSAGDDVVSTQLSDFATGDPAIVLLIRDGATNKLTMGGFSGSDFLDWGSANYSSYAVAGYEFLGDMLLQKNAPYITTYMRLTETGWTGDDITGYDPVNESSLLMSNFWDFGRRASSNPQQVYRLKFTPVIDEAALGTFDYPEDVITTRTKLRGRGRSMRLRFESEQGKDFILLGYSVLGGVNARF